MALQLPPEVWNHVFGYLSVADKLSVRASCKYFKKLVDHASLWKDWAAELDYPNSYNSQFWATLRRRKVTSVLVRSDREKDWKQLATSLPAVTTVVMLKTSRESLGCLKDFAHLRRLAIKRPLLGQHFPKTLTVRHPEQLTHLSMCDFTIARADTDAFISALSQFKNLKSLACHQIGSSPNVLLMICSILMCLPKLKHLSLSDGNTWDCHIPGPNTSPVLGALVPALSSFELHDYFQDSLPANAMRLMPGLRSLEVSYRKSYREMSDDDRVLKPRTHLTAWLTDLPQLSNLAVAKGPPVKEYVRFIPATLTSLTLCVDRLSPEDMAAVAAQVPNLLHLHVDPRPSYLGAHTAEIPQLFPKLKSLKLCHGHVPKEDFLRLHQLQDLKYLEVLDRSPRVAKLAAKLQALTQNRVQVSTPPRRTELTCLNVQQQY